MHLHITGDGNSCQCTQKLVTEVTVVIICRSEEQEAFTLSVGSFVSCFPVTVRKRRKNLSHLQICLEELLGAML